MNHSQREMMKGWTDSRRDSREKEWQGLSEHKRNFLRGSAKRNREQGQRETDYWDYAPSQFRTESVMMRASGAGFTSMFEDTNPRSASIAAELSATHHAPPFATKPTSASAKSMQDLYSNIPELQSLHTLSPKGKVQATNPYSIGPEQSMMHPYNTQFMKAPFPVSAKARDPYPRSNLRAKPSKGDSRV